MSSQQSQVADREYRRAFFLKRMRGRREDAVALRQLWKYRPKGRWIDVKVLEGIPFVVVGGVATRLYMPERTTADLDLLIEPKHFKAALKQLALKGYRREPRPLGFINTRLGLIGQRLIAATPLDILSSDQNWVVEAVATARKDDVGMPIVDLPYLVALKLDASRGIDQGDLTRMLGFASDADLTRVREIVGRLLPTDRDDLEQYIAIGKFEVGS